MVTDADRANLIAYVRSRDPRLITPSRRTPEQDTVYINALSDIERQLQEERLVPARATPIQHSTAIATETDRANLRAYVRSRVQRVKNPSRRTPERETVFNNADNVERQLQEDGHKIWGWVIYRCTYVNNEEWAEFMACLRYWNEYTLRSSNALDMLPSVDYQVFENPDLFDNAHPSTIREHFTQWAVTAPQQEQGEGAYPMRSQRYNYCLHVDQEALLSVIGGPPPSVLTFIGPGYVNLVCKTIMGGMRPEHTFGRAEQEHCFMRINYQSLMLHWYNQLRREGSWFTEYCVPPEVARI
jgi:hypothetical protein